ncbi:MAG: hypothetical protein ACTSQF_00175 [Candidatus Heimdallarchaeaceae archaeon]
MMNIKKTGSWFKDNLVGIIIGCLLAFIAWSQKSYIEGQQKLNIIQQELNLEFISSTVFNKGKCEILDGKVALNSDVNLSQGVTLLFYGQELVKHDVEIKHLQEDKK